MTGGVTELFLGFRVPWDPVFHQNLSGVSLRPRMLTPGSIGQSWPGAQHVE